MKSIFTAIAVIIAISAASMVVAIEPASAFTGSGAGTVGDPFEITTCDQFREIDSDNDASYELMTSIDCSSSGVQMVVSKSYVKFSGTFDGNNNSITVDIALGNDDVALFAYVNGASFSDLTVNGTVEGAWATGGFIGNFEGDGSISNVTSNVNVSGIRYVGGLVGRTLSNATVEISNSAATGDVASVNGDVGGLIGRAGAATILDSYASGDVSSSGVGDYVGGLAGIIDGNSRIYRSRATGDVSAPDSEDVGGFIGYNGGFIYESYATGSALGDEEVGGFVGENSNTIYDSYSRGNASGLSYVGGFVGYKDCGDEYNTYSTGAVDAASVFGGYIGEDDCGVADSSFWDTTTSGLGVSDTATGKTTSEMKDIATFTDLATSGLAEAWDFSGTQNDDAGTDDIWTIDGETNNGYPFFGWDIPEEEPEPDPEAPLYQATTTETPTGKAVTIEWDSNCDLSAFTVTAETVNSVQDVAFEYPNGLVDFTLESCDDNEVSISLYYHETANAAFVLRKFLPAIGSYSTVSNAVLVATELDGMPAVKATYTVLDNGPLDTNPADGIISDPAGIAQALIGAPRTGGGGTSSS